MVNQVTQVFGGAGGSQRLLVLFVGLGTLAVIWGLTQWGMAPTWVPVASGLPFEQISDATQRLDESGIEYRLEAGGGLITVSDGDLPRARVILASEGFTGSLSRPGFELFDQPSWGMTDFTQRVNYRRALEGELERTIGNMRGVESAQVHLALNEDSFLDRSDISGEASVVLRLRSGARADDAVVGGIQSLVASSVQRLEPDNVMVLDDSGRALSSAGSDSGVRRTERQLQVQTQIEGYLESKAEVIVEQMVGPGNTRVRVAVQLNFDQIDRTVQAVDPDQQFVISEETSEITPGSDQQGAGSVTTALVFEATRSVETLSRGGARVERLTVAVVLNDHEIEDPDGTVTFQARTPQELAQIESLVRNAVGVTDSRGDEITVVSIPFEKPPLPTPVEEESSVDVAGVLLAAQRPVVALAGLGVAVFLAFKLLGMLSLGSIGASTIQQLPAPVESRTLPPEPMQQRIPAEPAFQLTDPDMTARVVRSWMKDS